MTEEKNMIVQQPRIGKIGLVALITILGTAPPLSTDMYMPSLPTMAEYFGVSVTVTNFTMVVFFIFMAIGILICGPVSDRHGRKRILVLVLFIYMVASAGCALSSSIEYLIFFRGLQAVGAGGMISLSLALVKDSFEGHIRDTVLAIIQSMGVIAPIASPVIGAQILRVSNWRSVFWVLLGISFLCLVTAFLLKETHTQETCTDGSVFNTLKRLFIVGKNRNFTPFLLVVSVFHAPFMAYLAIASYTYINFFGLSETGFSLYFAFNAAVSVLGPWLFMKFNNRITPVKVMNITYIVGFASAAAIFLFGHTAPYVFSLTFIPYVVALNYSRPFATSILLRQQEGDTGSASSLLNFVMTAFSAFGMYIGSLKWPDFIMGLSITMSVFFVISIIGWVLMCKSQTISTFDK